MDYGGVYYDRDGNEVVEFAEDPQDYEVESQLQKNAELRQLKEKMNQILETLTPREAEVLRLRFGMKNGSPLTLEETAVQFKVTRERIRQIEAKALRKMRHPSRSKQIIDF